MKALSFDRLEKGLIILVSGFALWPNNFTIILLIVLIAVRLAQNLTFTKKGEIWLLIPAILLITAWAFHGFASDGFRELKLWPIWLLALFYWHSSPLRSFFQKSFVMFSGIQAIIILAFLAFISPFSSFDFAFQVRDTIGRVFNVHPTYLSAIWCWAALQTWFLNDWTRITRGVVSGFLFTMATVCGGKMAVLSAFAIIIHILFVFTTGRVWVRMLWSMFAIAGIAFLLFTPVMRNRLSEFQNIQSEYEQGTTLNSTQVRLGVWRCVNKEIHDHWIAGVGVGNTRKVLEECYSGYHQSEFFEGEFNTHNELAHFWLSGGIVAFLGYLIFYLLALFRCRKNADQALMIFLIYFFLISLTENYFSRQLGMVFWSFFAGPLISPKVT